jgi:2-C-methyl-D-erythritol 2,4-cyclodiphosphate synthase
VSDDPRIGLGHDRHRLEAGRPLWLGGLEVESDVGAVGHSDGDALLHAVTDAVLGACGVGDIGDLFPPGDPATAGAASVGFLREALRRAQALGFRVASVDSVVVTERPRLGSWKVRIRDHLAAILGLPPDRVGVKAKTAEGLGPVGEGLALEARAVVLLVRA